MDPGTCPLVPNFAAPTSPSSNSLFFQTGELTVSAKSPAGLGCPVTVRALFLLLALLSVPAVAAPPTAAEKLDKAQAAFDALSFDEAVRHYEDALKLPASRAERVAAFKGLGLCRAYMGDGPEATDAFMKLLTLDPDATVDSKLGNRITRPMEDAKRSMRSKRSSPSLNRSRSGDLQANFTDRSGLSHELRVRWRVKGTGEYKLAAGTLDKQLTVKTPPGEDIEAFLQVVDGWEGVLFEVGTQAAPKELAAVVRSTAAVRSVMDDVNAKTGHAPKPASGAVMEEERGAPAWPWWLVGTAVVVGGGVAAGWYLTRPSELTLPQADRTGTLP